MKNKLASLILLSFIVIFPVTFMWQGLDVTDTGYALTNCQEFFRAYPHDLTDPAIGSLWLSYLIGGLWYQLTGCGVIGFRVLYLLVTFSILGLVWLPLRRFGSSKALAAVLAGSAIVVAKSLYLPSYNEFTALFFVVTALALYRGLLAERKLWIFIGGVAAGASIFVRLPNLAIGAIVVAILFYRGIEASGRKQFFTGAIRQIVKECSVFAFGYVAGIALVLSAMAALGHLTAYFGMIRQMSAMFEDPSEHHGAWPLLKTLLHDYFYAGIAGAAFLAVGIFVARLSGSSARRWLRASIVLLIAVGVTLLLIAARDADIYLWPGLIYAILFAGAIGLLNLDKQLRLLCVLAGIVLFVTPLGSNNGIFNAVYAMHLAVPVALLALLSRSAAPATASDVAASGRWKRLYNRAWNAGASLDTTVVGYAVLCSLIAFSVVHRWQFTYRDSSRRLAMRSEVDHPKLRHLFTTANRAKSLGELLQHLQPLVGKGDYLMDHAQIPLIYFLTETKPYLASSWANLYAPPAFKRAIDQALLTKPSLPVCVRTKVDTCHPDWPDGTYPPASSYRFAENCRLLKSFLEKNSYRKCWEDKAFEIWLPPSYADTR